MPTWLSRAISCGSDFTSSFTPIEARPIPAIVPNNDSSSPSTKNWRTSRKRPAPSATRIAISLLRAACCASRRPAMFAHAINNTRPTAAINVKSAGLTSPATSFINALTIIPSSLLAGYSWANRVPMVFISTVACSIVIPGFSRPTTPST